MTFKNILPKAFKYYLLSFFAFLLFYTNYAQKYEKQTLIVKLKDEYRDVFKNKSHAFISDFESVKPIFKNSKKSKVKLGNIYKVHLKNHISVEEACKKFKSCRYFEYMQPNFLDELLYTPSDPRTGTQYALSICQAFEAWDIHKGDSNIVIGVSDTGVDFDHEDLRKNVAYNINDPIDGVDNDFDGYTDNYMGRDFGSNDNNPQWNESGTSGNKVHGIFTCGLAGARTDNELGMAAFGFRTKFLPIKISDDNGQLVSGYESIIYAAEHGCDIVNCSWGSTTPHDYGRDVIEYVTEVLDVIIVGAAGNNDNEDLFYPASYKNVVSVAASNNIDTKWENSSYNWRVDIAAPGEYVLSTLQNNTYSTSSGTSFSAPIVSASLALLKSYYPDSLSNTQLIEILKTNGDKIDTSASNINYKNKLGKSRLNLFKALQANIKPAVRAFDFELLKNNQIAFAGDTAILSGYLSNLLLPVENLNVSISSTSQYINILNDNFTIPLLGENESVNLSDQNIEIVISPDTPDNEYINFLITYTGDGYEDEELRSITINYPHIDFNKNHLSSSIFPEGKLGSGYTNFGQGFSLNGMDNLLYEMGVIAGISPENTISNARGYNDFSAISTIDSLTVDSVWYATNTFENQNILPINIKVNYESYEDTLYKNMVFINYDLVNNSNQNLNDFYLGIFADWDIVHYENNYTSIDTSLRLAISQCFAQEEIVAIQVLSDGPWNRFAFDNINGNTDIDSRNGISREEFYHALSNQSYFSGLGSNGTDVLDLVSSGPFIINTQDTLKLSFAIHADTSFENIINSATKAQHLYDSLHTVNSHIAAHTKENKFSLYPSPSKDFIYIIRDPELQDGFFEIYNIYGKAIIRKKLSKSVIDVSILKPGVYFIMIDNATKKFIIE